MLKHAEIARRWSLNTLLALKYWEMKVFVKGEKDGQLNNFISSKVLGTKLSVHPSMPLRTETTIKIWIFMFIYPIGDFASFKTWTVF